MSVYNTKDTPVNLRKLDELLSMKGDGEDVSEGTTIWYKVPLRDKDGQEVGFRIKKQVKKVGGRATPRTSDKRDTDKVGSMDKSDIDHEGNIKSPRTFKVYEDGESRKGTDLEFLRKKRKKQKIKTGKTRPDTVPPFRKAGGMSVDYRKRSGGLFNRMGKK